ncbi:MAG TPA: hypothetical protein VMD91_15675 [Candidatus Sulfotelmatobacter sp.]|nr:hypothetical protein [Candidatus Sulfotelmatobacter sp.]
MRAPALVAAIAFAALVAGCSRPTGPQQLAVATTRAVYANNVNAAVANFEPALRSQVTSASVAQLSDAMHAMGAMHGFSVAGSTPAQGRYDYTVAFDKGRMLVQLRLDGDRRIAAYRITPLAQ